MKNEKCYTELRHIGRVLAIQSTIDVEWQAPPDPKKRSGIGKLEKIYQCEKAVVTISPFKAFRNFDGSIPVRWKKAEWIAKSVAFAPTNALIFHLVKVP